MVGLRVRVMLPVPETEGVTAQQVDLSVPSISRRENAPEKVW